MHQRENLNLPPLVALAGSANSGKTTLFNLLTGSHYDTVNYPGSTVEFTVGISKRIPDFACRIMDTPGLSSLKASSPDEQVTVDALFEGDHCPDIVLCVVDANQLSRHLYLARQLQESGFPMALIVTMQDRLQQHGLTLRPDRLSEMLDCPVHILDPRHKQDLSFLSATLKKLQLEFDQKPNPGKKDHERIVELFNESHVDQIYRALDEVERMVISNVSTVSTLKPKATADTWLLHPVFGLLIFFLIMTGIFTSIFWMAAPIMDWIDAGFGNAIGFLKANLPQSWITDLLSDGLIGGAGAVAVFLPQIVILFLALGYLEDSGYLARGAALVDKPLSMMGLNGKSFVPLLSGYACAIPAMLAARTIANRKERFLTLLIVPLMSCSARLPVYTLLLAYLLPRDKPWLGGIALTGLYLLGILLGAAVSTVAAHFLKNSEPSRFMLELPALRMPQLRVVLVSTYHKTFAYVRKAGLPIILIASILWVLTHTPSVDSSTSNGQEYVTLSQSYAAKIGHGLEWVTKPMGLDWRGGVALLCGFSAREVFVSALALSYRVHGETEDGLTGHLLSAMPEMRFEDGTPIFTTASTLGLLVFYIIALQCFATVAVARNEMGSWKLAITQLLVFTGVAYALAVGVVQGLRMVGVG